MKHSKDSFFSNKVQEIHTNLQGTVTRSSDNLFSIKKGDTIFDLHPFFESLQGAFISENQSNLAFPCVQLDLQDKEIICDITVKKERGFIAILLFDYSEHYEHLHQAAQEKKTAMLNEQAHELNAKHHEEKRVYFEYIRNRMDDKILGTLKTIVADIEKFKSTELTKAQQKLIAEIQTNMNDLYQKASQIKDNLEKDLN